MKKVVKRDGRVAEFDPIRIRSAVGRAQKAVGDKDLKGALQSLVAIDATRDMAKIDGDTVTVGQVQRAVENSLMKRSPVVARAYIEYRHDRDVAREERGAIYQKLDSLIIRRDDADMLHENANKNSETIATMRDMAAGIVSRERGLLYYEQADKEFGRRIAEDHKRGFIHLHDLDYSPLFPEVNCCLIALRDMLARGFRMGNAEIATPKSITTACAITAQIIAQVASHQYGGCTVNGIDCILEPYVKTSWEKHLWYITSIAPERDGKEELADKATEKECYDAFQALEYEINTLHTANGQTPFVTLGFGLGTSKYARWIQKAILRNRIDGLGVNHRTAVFPKLIFAIKDGINRKPSDPNYDIKKLALKCASERMYPDILNYEQVVKVTGSFKYPMGCRSFLPKWINANGVEETDGRCNLGVVSVNLPRVAILAKGNWLEFWRILDEELEVCFRALMVRIHRMGSVKAKVAPILYMEGAYGVRLKADDPVAPIFKNGRASVSLGYIGVNETLRAMHHNQDPFESELLRTEGEMIVKHLHDACVKWREETGYGFSLYGTPAENLCRRFCALDKAEFGVIEGVTDKDYYTNSFHLDVRYKTDAYSKIEFETPYPALSSGGFICYAEFPNMRKNLEALEDVWDFTYTRIPYFGTNTPVDQCFECGYRGEFECTSKGFTCPSCGCHDPAKVSVIRRVCGYLGAPDARPFNSGKQEEVMERVKHVDDGAPEEMK